MLCVNLGWGQTTVFSESFTGTNNTLTTAASPSMTYTSNLGLTSSTAGAAYINTNQLIIENGNNSTATNNTSGVGYVKGANSSFGSPFSTTLDSNPSTVTWSFNIRTTRGSLSNNFGTSTSYGGMVVLACDNANPTAAGSKGYAIWLGRGSSTSFHSFKIVYFTDGVNQAAAPTTICATADVTTLKYYSLKVTFNPSAGSKLWTLSFRDDGATAFAQPLSTGTSYNATVSSGTNSSGTNLALANFAFVWRYATANGQNLYIDNFKVTLDNPTINAPSVSSLTGFTATGSSYSAEQSFTVSGQFLTNSIVATASTDYEVSTTSGGTFGATASITNAATQSGTIYVRLKTGLSDGSKNGNITITSSGATTTGDYSVTSHTIALTGTVSSNPTLTPSTASLTQFANTAAGANSASSSFTLSGVNLSSGNVTVTAPTNFAVSTDNSTFSSSVSITPSSGSVSSTIYVRYSPTGSGNYSDNVVIAWSGLADQNVAVSGYLSTFYYKSGSTSLATAANWSGTADGTGTSVPTNFTTAGVTYQILSSSPTTTDALWTVSGLGSKIIVGNSTVAGVTLTIASGFAIAGTIDVAQSNLYTDPNKVVVKEYTTLPTFGTLHDESEVHYQNATAASLSVGTGYTYGKLIVDAGTAAVNFTGSPVVIKKALTVSTGAIGQFSGTSGNWTIINTGAVVTINGKLQSSKLAGIFNFGVSTPSSSNGCLQFFDTAADVATNSRLVLGANSTVEYNRNTFNNTQAISALPPGIKYANLNITDTYSTTTKSFAAALSGGSNVTVTGTLTVAQFASTLAGNVTMGDGATIVMAGTNGFTTEPTLGTSVNLSYTPIKMPGVFTCALGLSSGTLTTANPNITVGMGVSASGIPEGTTVTFISGTNISLSNAVTSAFSTATVTFDKYVAQTSGTEVPTDASKLKDVTINNSAGVTLASATAMKGILTVTSGTLTTGGFLTLKSTECCTATVAEVLGSISGTVTAERFIPVGQRAYRLLSSPVTTTTFIDTNWQTGTHITGPQGATNGFDPTTSNGSSMFTYNNASPAWTAVGNTNATVLTAGVPYLTYIRGGRTESLTVTVANPPVSVVSTAATLSATGALKTGDVPVTGLNETAGGYSLIGNPYQAQVDMAAIFTGGNATASNLSTAYYWVVDPSLGTKGGYLPVDVAEAAVAHISQYLQPGQACFVQNSLGGAASLTFKEVHKSSAAAQTTIFRTRNTATANISVTLSDVNAKRLDVLKIAFDPSYSNAVDYNDATKMTNFDESMASSNSGKLLSIEKRALPNETDEIPLSITKYRGTTYSIKAEGAGLTGPSAYLFDKYTSTTTEIPQDGSVNYAYTVDAAVPASIAADRFKLIYAKTLKTIDNELTGFALYPNPSQSNSFNVVVPQTESKVSLSVSNLLGQQLYAQNDVPSGATAKVTVSNVKTAGIYLVSLTAEGKTATTKWIVE